MTIPTKMPIEGLTHELKATGEVVLFDADRQELLVLNDVGAGVWHLIDGHRSVADIVQCVRDALEVDAAQGLADVTNFLQQLSDRGLVALDATDGGHNA